MPLHVDYETRSRLDLRKVGAYKYAMDPSTDILCMAYAFDDEPVQLWDAQRDPLGFPLRVLEYIAAGGMLHAWNAAFERLITRHVLPRYVVLTVPDRQWRCTMAEAYAMGLPGKLEQCAPVLLGKTGIKKDMKGHALMQRVSKPRTLEPLTWWDDDERLDRLGAYCCQDVEVERACGKKLRPLSDAEQEIWFLDLAINDQGVCIDVPLVKAALAITIEAQRRANDELAELTNGEITAATQHARFPTWLRSRGIDTDSADKDAVAWMLALPGLDPVARRVLELRRETAMSSTAKLKSILDMLMDDGRVRGLIQYHAAHTGRWGGRGIQPQNFARGEVKNAYDFIDMVLRGDYDGLGLCYPPLRIVSSIMRAMLIAPPGEQFGSWDYSAIEPRVAAWLAGQEDALARYRSGEDEYIVMASHVYGLPRELIKKFPHRQLGKAIVLGAIFGLGWRGLTASAAKAPYFLELQEELARQGIDTFRTLWDQVPVMWRGLEEMVKNATDYPRQKFSYGKLSAVANNAWLLVRLPSGRLLTYAQPTVRSTEMPWTDRNGDPVYRDACTRGDRIRKRRSGNSSRCGADFSRRILCKQWRAIYWPRQCAEWQSVVSCQASRSTTKSWLPFLLRTSGKKCDKSCWMYPNGPLPSPSRLKDGLARGIASDDARRRVGVVWCRIHTIGVRDPARCDAGSRFSYCRCRAREGSRSVAFRPHMGRVFMAHRSAL